MKIILTLDVGTGTDLGLFDLYSDSDGYTTNFNTSSITRQELLDGYVTTLTPSGTTIIRITSTGDCTNSYDSLLSPFFNSGTGFDLPTFDIEVQSDRKILIGGSFTLYNGVSEIKIVRLNLDGTVDGTFSPSFNGNITDIIVQSDNKIIVAGSFTGTMVRLNSDGTVDSSLDVGSGFNFTGNESLELQSDGKIIVGGAFTNYDGTGANKIIRLNSDGSIDGSFVYGTGFNSTVFITKVQTDGKILVGGSYSTYQATGTNRIIRLNSDGTVDSSFVYGTGFDSDVTSIYIQSDGKILVGGNFSTYNGTGANRIIRLNSDGSIDSSFVYGVGFNGSYTRDIEVQSDGKILIGGLFILYNGVGANNIVRLNSNGTVDSSFVYGTGFIGTTGGGIKVQSDGKILIGGNFTSYNGTSAVRIIRLNSDGSINS